MTTIDHSPKAIVDEDLRCDVADELEFDPAIDATNIGVSVTDHTVTLGGTVHALSQRLMAVKAASRVKGVHAIVDEIAVVPPSGVGDSDAAIGAHIESVLEGSASVPRSVRAVVRNGEVRLTGEVSYNFQRDAALRAVRDVKGVRWVDNFITLADVPAGGEIRTKIISAMHRNANTDAGGIHVMVTGRDVWLSGTVSSIAARRQAEITAWSAAGVQAVHNQIVVR